MLYATGVDAIRSAGGESDSKQFLSMKGFSTKLWICGLNYVIRVTGDEKHFETFYLDDFHHKFDSVVAILLSGS